MNMYDKHPQAQAMQILVHDINQRTSGIREAVRLLESGDFKPAQLASLLRGTEKLIHRTVDEYYTKFKADFPA